ncbi:hypothetical protein AVEN_32864-1 [Araneus ventricosus]|uniref:Uncharacterized protein n=1 Tax=Araneus ventricosus TaxID=182803 RepID=A0A4Y2DYC3_ARAVE|nr:hypothetical protein AVEN_32864-1 [Araneus ventricosus]
MKFSCIDAIKNPVPFSFHHLLGLAHMKLFSWTTPHYCIVQPVHLGGRSQADPRKPKNCPVQVTPVPYCAYLAFKMPVPISSRAEVLNLWYAYP